MPSCGFGRFLALDELSAPDIFSRQDNFSLDVARPSGTMLRERRRDTGVESRLIVRQGQSVYSMVRRWFQNWLQETGMEPFEIGGMVITSCSAENLQGVAEDVQRAEHIPGQVIAVDDACSGFVAATVAALRMNAGEKPVVIVAAESTSRIINWEPPTRDGDDDRARGKAAKIFGDGVAGVALGPMAPHLHEVLDAHVDEIDDPQHLICLTPVERSLDVYGRERAGVHGCMNMPGRNGRILLDSAPQTMVQAMQRSVMCAKDIGRMEDWEQVSHVVPHQANRAITIAIQSLLKDEGVMVWDRIGRSGNTAAASIPIAMADIQNDAAIRTRDIVALPAVGARGPGFVPGKLSAGCVLIRKGKPRHS